MAKITDITPQIKDKNRCNIFLDGVFFCGLMLETAVANRLKVGQEIDKEKLAKIQLDSEKHTALDKAMNYISRSMKTKAQIQKYLKGKGYTLEVSEYVLFKLTDYRFVDDGEYSKIYAKEKSRGKGRRLIELELKQKGIASEDIEDALLELQDELTSAKAVLEKYLRHKPKDEASLYKGFKYLLSKGFEYETAGDAVSQLKSSGFLKEDELDS